MIPHMHVGATRNGWRSVAVICTLAGAVCLVWTVKAARSDGLDAGDMAGVLSFGAGVLSLLVGLAGMLITWISYRADNRTTCRGGSRDHGCVHPQSPYQAPSCPRRSRRRQDDSSRPPPSRPSRGTHVLQHQTGACPVLPSLLEPAPAGELYDWIADELAVHYAGLAEYLPGADGPVTRARALLDDQRILPILDGFDELPAALRPSALDGINQALPLGQGVVVSSRTAEFREAAHPSSGIPIKLAGAAGIHLTGVDPAHSADYLRRDAAWACHGIGSALGLRRLPSGNDGPVLSRSRLSAHAVPGQDGLQPTPG